LTRGTSSYYLRAAKARAPTSAAARMAGCGAHRPATPRHFCLGSRMVIAPRIFHVGPASGWAANTPGPNE
jgi:hypothetical protein